MAETSELLHLVRNMSPVLNQGDYVFCTLRIGVEIEAEVIVASVYEMEGRTVVIPLAVARQNKLTYTSVMSWITLNVHSSLEAVGLTAVVSDALAKENISCNMLAGYYHDHLFVLKEDSTKTIVVLIGLSQNFSK
ncbi:MAG: ACT domain-containing protein [Cyclobacteriaceae bacterium]